MLTLTLTALLAAAPPQLALLSTSPDGITQLRFVRPGEPLPAPLASLEHRAGELALGALLPRRDVVLAIALTSPSRDRSFGATLFRLEPGQPTRALADRVAYATRPLVTAEGRAFVQRGLAGDDLLSIDEVNPDTAQARTVYTARGSTAFLAGALGAELFVYLVDELGGHLLAVQVDTLAVRVLRSQLEPLARDFVVDARGRRLIYTQGEASSGRWRVEALSLSTGEVATLATGGTMALLPTLLPDGAIAWAPAAGGGLVRPGGAQVLAARGPGFERVRGIVGRQAEAIALGLHERPSALPEPFAVSLSEGHSTPVPFPPGAQLDIAGVRP